MDYNTLLNNISKNEENIVAKKTEYKKDERYWKLSLVSGADGVKRGSAKIRFLTNFNQELERPYVELTKYFISGFSKKPYVENSRRSISFDEKDPVYELSGKLYKTNEDHWQAFTKKMRPNYAKVACIQIIDDPANPENNGKVKIYDMPKTVFTKIEKAFTPDDAFTEKLNPFHPIEGADFVVSASIKSKDDGGNGIPDYAASKFLAPSAMSGGDPDTIMEVLKSQPDLAEFIAPDQYKPYEELLKLLYNTVKDDIPDRFFAGTSVVANSVAPNAPSTAPAEKVVDESPAFVPDTNEGSATLDATASTTTAGPEDDAEIDDFIAKMQKEMQDG